MATCKTGSHRLWRRANPTLKSRLKLGLSKQKSTEVNQCSGEKASNDGSFLADEDCWEGWWSILACSLVVVVWWVGGGGSGPMVKVLWTVWAGVGPWFERLLPVCQSSVVPCLFCSLSVRLTVCRFCSPSVCLIPCLLFCLSVCVVPCTFVCLVPGLSAWLSCSLFSLWLTGLKAPTN